MLLSLAFAFLAQLPDPKSAEAIGWLAVALTGLMATANQGLGLLGKIRGMKAPGDITEDRIKAIEGRMHAIELKMENHMGAMSTQFKAISDTLTNLQSDWNYAIGRIDGRHESGH